MTSTKRSCAFSPYGEIILKKYKYVQTKDKDATK